ncbi:MAG: hypothetical protein U0610_02080 [bacterium]
MSTNDPKDVDRAHPSWLGTQRQRASHMESAEFGRTLRGLLDGLEIDIFEEEWQQVTIVNRAKELALAVGLDGGDFWMARRELEEFYARKRRFFLDEDEGEGED